MYCPSNLPHFASFQNKCGNYLKKKQNKEQIYIQNQFRVVLCSNCPINQFENYLGNIF